MIPEDKYIEIAELVIDQAEIIFKKCNAESDFCLQAIGSRVVFGGTNRVFFSPLQGFTIDPDYCTPNFRKLFEINFK
jgi:hypothetical protein